MQHTPTPWIAEYDKGETIGRDLIFMCWGETPETENANAQRIVACVNALEGYDNPAQFIESFEALKNEYLDCLEAMAVAYQELVQRNEVAELLSEIVRHSTTATLPLPEKLIERAAKAAAGLKQSSGMKAMAKFAFKHHPDQAEHCQHSDDVQNEPPFETPYPEPNV